MKLNAVSMFGKVLNWNSGATYALTIIAMIILIAVAVALAIKLVKLLKQAPVEQTEEGNGDTTVIVVSQEPEAEEEPEVIVKKKKKKKAKKIIIEEEEEPETVIIRKKKKKGKKVVIVEEEQPEEELNIVEIPAPAPVVQQQPQYVYVQQAPPPKIAAAAAPVVAPYEEGEDFEDEEDIIEESVEGGVVRYNRSFQAKYVQSNDEAKNYYVHLKNKLLSYKRVRSRISWKRESFSFGRNPMARFVFRGKTLCLCLPLDPAKFTESKYHVEDVSEIALYSDTPCLYRIRNDRRLEYAYELIEMVASQLGTVVDPARHDEDYYMPYEGIVQLIDKGLVRRVIRRKDNTYLNSDKV